MTIRRPIPEMDKLPEEQAVVLECLRCGSTAYKPLIESFWRRLAA
jgi:hypothetical protein